MDNIIFEEFEVKSVGKPMSHPATGTTHVTPVLHKFNNPAKSYITSTPNWDNHWYGEKRYNNYDWRNRRYWNGRYWDWDYYPGYVYDYPQVITTEIIPLPNPEQSPTPMAESNQTNNFLFIIMLVLIFMFVAMMMVLMLRK
jgi:hypothetical protein